MRYLLYCIFNLHAGVDLQGSSKPETLLGVGGQPVSLIAKNSLSATISRIAHSDLTPNISRILAYEKVIESFHSNLAIRGVIPMRYGCLFEEESQISRFLEERGQEFEALLKELEGCVEIGIRILIAECGLRLREPSGSERMRNGEWRMENPQSEIRNPESLTPGQAYLAVRKAYYEQEERFAKKINELAEQCRMAFSGLFVKCKTECSSLGIPILSLYFLVPRRSVEPFRKVFRHISHKESAKLLLSGPWPPYNFVLPHQIREHVGFRGSGQKEGFLYGGE